MGVSKLGSGVASVKTFGTVNFLPGLGVLKKSRRADHIENKQPF